MTNPCFAKITNGSLEQEKLLIISFQSESKSKSTYDHRHSGSVYTRMSYHTIASFQHTFRLAAMGTHRKTLDILAKITKSSIFLFSKSKLRKISVSNLGVVLNYGLNEMRKYFLECHVCRGLTFCISHIPKDNKKIYISKITQNLIWECVKCQ